jgi:hypothetical protein
MRSNFNKEPEPVEEEKEEEEEEGGGSVCEDSSVETFKNYLKKK